MARKAKVLQVWTLRNASGQYIGNYRAYSADAAISRFMNDQNVYMSIFRHGTPVKAKEIYASVEPSDNVAIIQFDAA